MAQKTGALIFDEQTDRYDIRFDIADYYGGLHCGECFDVFTGGKWKPTRIEMSAAQEWYLVGIRAEDLNGLPILVSMPLRSIAETAAPMWTVGITSIPCLA